MNTELENELKHLIVNALQLDDVRAEDIACDDALFVKGLGLDSIDALELAGSLERKYGIKITQESPDVREAFASVRALAAFVASAQRRIDPADASGDAR